MHSRAEVDLVLALGTAGATQSDITRLTGISRTTVRNWLAGRTRYPQIIGECVRAPRAYEHLDCPPGGWAALDAFVGPER